MDATLCLDQALHHQEFQRSFQIDSPSLVYVIGPFYCLAGISDISNKRRMYDLPTNEKYAHQLWHEQ